MAHKGSKAGYKSAKKTLGLSLTKSKVVSKKTMQSASRKRMT